LWKYSRSLDLNAAWELAWSGDLSVNQTPSAYRGTISGTYNNVYFMFFGLGLNWHF
jgi:hypothetical protein